MPMFRVNKPKVYADAAKIVRRLRTTSVTLGALIKEYRCAYKTMVGAILTQIDRQEFQDLMSRRYGRKNHGCFRKGHVSWNKGRKGWCPAGCTATQFRAGMIRG